MKKQQTAALAAALAVTAISLTGCAEANQKGYTPNPAPQYSAQEKNDTDGCYDTTLSPGGQDSHFNKIKESGFLYAEDTPLSTFSADVDTASYSYVRRMLTEQGALDPDSIRLEEMINYFHYDYKMPEDGNVLEPTMEVASCPWNPDHALMMIGVQAMQPATTAASNLVFLIDVSGSMRSDDKIGLVKESFQLLTEQVGEQDTISIVTYSGAEKVVLDGARGDQTEQILKAVNSLSAGGCTNGAAGLEMAYNVAQKHFVEGGNNRVIMATDGDLNVGLTSQDELKTYIESKREEGVFLSTLGYGTGNYNDALLETVADYGNGNYHYIDGQEEARKVLCEELSGTLFTVAKDVKFQVEFNPWIVNAYRLIGYENRALADEDFTDDTKDAGEVGAGHQVTVLYELSLTDDKPLGTTSLEYQTKSFTDSENFATLHLAYKAPDADKSQSFSVPITPKYQTDSPSDSFLLASSVAEFGMLLRDSEYLTDPDYSGLLRRLSDIPDAYGFHDLVQIAADRANPRGTQNEY